MEKGYKCFNPGLKCRGFEYEIGKTFKHDGPITLCGAGFHFCNVVQNVFSYYDFNTENIVCEVEASGEIIHSKDKSVCSEITIIRQLTWQEVLEVCNTGTGNTGHSNSGDRNSGYRNSGDRNSGDRNSGDRNSGDRNSGDRNSGYRNSGDRNSGDLNSGYLNSGYLNSDTPKVRIFNKQTDLEFNDRAFNRIHEIDIRPTVYIYSEEMSDKEKEQHSGHETTGGYVKNIPYKEAWANFWGNASEDLKEYILNLPEFDKDIFKKITGIEVLK